MDREIKQKLREGRDALQENNLPDKWEIIEMHDLISDLDGKLERIKSLAGSNLSTEPKGTSEEILMEILKVIAE